ncbi:MAG: hypothetical protein KKG14_10345 [Alphaproteobacteria bacterium]|nr:hypothetical protein [Alphaproteobacteria bacterium]MBU2419088.1 hypothetical protein [Alphaproteobacteria bacterium]
MVSFVEEYGSFGRLVGQGTFLSDEMAEDVVALVALDLMSQAVRVGLSGAGQIALRHVVLAWMKQRRSGEAEPRLVTVQPDDLAMLMDTGMDVEVLVRTDRAPILIEMERLDAKIADRCSRHLEAACSRRPAGEEIECDP